MPKTLTNQNTADTYTDQGGANINSVYQSRGGWVTLPASAYAQIQHSPEGAQQGQEQWSEEFVLPSGAHYLQPGLIGIRFRSFTPGNPVAVSAALFFKDEPAMQLGGSGISTPSSSVASLNFQHNDTAVATEPTADFEDQTGSATMNLTWTVVDDPANTRVKITPVPVWANPTIFPHSISTGPGSAGSSATNGVFIQDAASTGGGIWSVGANSAFTSWATFVNGDTNPRFTIFQSGNLFWGPGNAATDTNLSRSAAGVLNLQNSLQIQPTASGNTALATFVGGDTNFRFILAASGLHQWGPGNAATDTTLQRVGAGILQLGITGQGGRLGVQQTSGNNLVFTAAVDGDTNSRYLIFANGSMQWGPGNAAVDISLFRAFTSQLKITGLTSGGAYAASIFASNYGSGISVGGDGSHASWSLVDNANHECFVSVVPDAVSGWTSLLTTVVGDTTGFRFQLEATGIHKWGPGNAATDTTMQRAGAGILNVTTSNLSIGPTNATNGVGGVQSSYINNGSIVLTGPSTAGGAVGTSVVGDTTAYRLLITSDGTHTWSPGNAAGDLTLARLVNSPTGTGTFLELTLGAGLGYGTGTGGTVTQITSLTTGVTINKPTGAITTFSSALAGSLNVTFLVTNSVVGGDDVVIVNWAGVVSTNIPIWVSGVSNGSFQISYTNLGGLTGAAANTINFAVIKGARA